MSEEQEPEEEYTVDNGPFIEQFTEHIVTHEGTKPLWAKTLAYIVFGLFCNLVNLGTKAGHISTNIFGMYIGPSKIAFKTVTQEHIIDPILEMVQNIFWNEIPEPNEQQLNEAILAANIENLNAEDKRKAIKKIEARLKEQYKVKRDAMTFLLPADFSGQILPSLLKTRKRGLMIEEEFTKVVKGVKNSSYLSTKIETLSDLYDGKIGGRASWTHGEEELVRNLCVSYVTTTTYAIFKMGLDIYLLFLQGFANRLCLVIFEKEDALQQLEKPFNVREWLDIEEIPGEHNLIQKGSLDIKNRTWAKRLVVFYKQLNKILSEGKLSVVWSESALKILEEYVPQLVKQYIELFTKDEFDLEPSYLANFKIQVLKFSLIHAVSKYWGWDLERYVADCNGHGIILIDREDVEDAKLMLNSYKEQFEKLREKWMKYAEVESTPVLSYEPTLKLVTNYINAHKDNDGYVRKSAMERSLKLVNSNPSWKSVQENDLEIQVRSPTGDTGKGRPGIYVRLKDEKDEVIS